MEWISASDLEKYCYCPLSWSLSKRAEVTSSELDRGKVEHFEMAEDLGSIVVKEKRAAFLERVVLWSSVLATLLAVVGAYILSSDDLVMRSRVLAILSVLWIILAVFFLFRSLTSADKRAGDLHHQVVPMLAIIAMVTAINAVPIFGVSEEQGLIYEVIAMVLLIMACIALLLSRSSSETAKRLRSVGGVRGRVDYIGEGNAQGRLLRSETYRLTGRPDYIVEINGELVPVEVKSGRMPRGPLFSHILQTAAYCLLLEEEEGRTTYGILRYRDVEHEIEYSKDLKALLISKLEEMRTSRTSGTLHRNHNRPGKCRSCSRRSLCPEKLE